MRPGVGPPEDEVSRLAKKPQWMRQHTCVGVTRRFLHGDEGKEDRINAVLVTALLEVLVILCTSSFYATVERSATDLRERNPRQVRCGPSITVNANIEPALSPVNSR